MLEAVRSELPEFPEARAERFVREYGIPAYDAGVLTVERELADYFEAVVKGCGDPKSASNWVMGEVLRTIKEKSLQITSYPIEAQRLADLLGMIRAAEISTTIAKQVFDKMLESGLGAAEIVEREGLKQVSDTSEIEKVVRAILDENADQVEQYRAGKTKVFGFFVGQCMKAMKGKANPAVVNDILKGVLDS